MEDDEDVHDFFEALEHSQPTFLYDDSSDEETASESESVEQHEMQPRDLEDQQLHPRRQRKRQRLMRCYHPKITIACVIFAMIAVMATLSFYFPACVQCLWEKDQPCSTTAFLNSKGELVQGNCSTCTELGNHCFNGGRNYSYTTYQFSTCTQEGSGCPTNATVVLRSTTNEKEGLKEVQMLSKDYSGREGLIGYANISRKKFTITFKCRCSPCPFPENVKESEIMFGRGSYQDYLEKEEFVRHTMDLVNGMKKRSTSTLEKLKKSGIRQKNAMAVKSNPSAGGDSCYCGTTVIPINNINNNISKAIRREPCVKGEGNFDPSPHNGKCYVIYEYKKCDDYMLPCYDNIEYYLSVYYNRMDAKSPFERNSSISGHASIKLPEFNITFLCSGNKCVADWNLDTKEVEISDLDEYKAAIATLDAVKAELEEKPEVENSAPAPKTSTCHCGYVLLEIDLSFQKVNHVKDEGCKVDQDGYKSDPVHDRCYVTFVVSKCRKELHDCKSGFLFIGEIFFNKMDSYHPSLDGITSKFDVGVINSYASKHKFNLTLTCRGDYCFPAEDLKTMPIVPGGYSGLGIAYRSAVNTAMAKLMPMANLHKPNAITTTTTTRITTPYSSTVINAGHLSADDSKPAEEDGMGTGTLALIICGCIVAILAIIAAVVFTICAIKTKFFKSWREKRRNKKTKKINGNATESSTQATSNTTNPAAPAKDVNAAAASSAAAQNVNAVAASSTPATANTTNPAAPAKEVNAAAASVPTVSATSNEKVVAPSKPKKSKQRTLEKKKKKPKQKVMECYPKELIYKNFKQTDRLKLNNHLILPPRHELDDVKSHSLKDIEFDNDLDEWCWVGRDLEFVDNSTISTSSLCSKNSSDMANRMKSGAQSEYFERGIGKWKSTVRLGVPSFAPTGPYSGVVRIFFNGDDITRHCYINPDDDDDDDDDDDEKNNLPDEDPTSEKNNSLSDADFIRSRIKLMTDHFKNSTTEKIGYSKDSVMVLSDAEDGVVLQLFHRAPEDKVHQRMNASGEEPDSPPLRCQENYCTMFFRVIPIGYEFVFWKHDQDVKRSAIHLFFRRIYYRIFF